jgi:membrane protease YdiL (CAAX protease family)
VTSPGRNRAGRRRLLALFTAMPALVNAVALWLLQDAWLAIGLSALVFASGGWWLVEIFGWEERVTLPRRSLGPSAAFGAASTALLGGIVIAGGALFFQRTIPGNLLAACSQRLVESGVMRYGFATFMVCVGVVLPVAEEVYWRAGVQGMLAADLPRGRTVLADALLFTGYHAVTVSYLVPRPAGLALIPFIFGGGLAFSWLTERTGNVWAAAATHSIGVWGATLYLIWKYLI